ncbi:MAG: sulfotransferase family protein [Cyanobacteria bacterium P01_A01_bin.123]
MSKIFNIGLPKTGTVSLNAALVLLGYRSLHNPLDLRFMSYKKGIYNYPRDDWDAITNFGENFYPQLDRSYPNSKFILTYRSKDTWLKSAENWYSQPPAYPPRDNKARLEIFGCMQFNLDRFSYVYDAHYSSVNAYFKDRPEDLLILNFGKDDLWLKLCGFLDKTIPDIPFPRKNPAKNSTSSIHRARMSLRNWIRYWGQ